MRTRSVEAKRRSARTSGRAGAEVPELSPDVVRATAAFRASLRRFERTSEQIGLERGLTPRRYLLLLMIKGSLDGSERATVSELTERLQLAQHTVTELVGRAEDGGLIRREPSTDDGRVCYLRLTAEGERRLARAFSDLDTERRALMAALQEPSSPKPRRSGAHQRSPGASAPRSSRPRSSR
ncbi:MAG: MarR family winged helix-turn-helix transcriptional regulator [Solirubrobacteraceae bacterium]